MKMKNRHYAALVMAATFAAASTSTFAWNRTDVGPVIPGDGTYALGADIQASNTWDQWYWNGKNHGMAVKCNGPITESCTYSLGRNVTTSYDVLQGTSVAAGLGVTLGGFTPQYQYAVTKTHQQTKSSTDFIANGVVFRGGYWANPIKVAVRRWKRGSFNGAWFRTGWLSGGGNNTVYDWLWKKHGYWTANVYQYQYIHFQVEKTI